MKKIFFSVLFIALVISQNVVRAQSVTNSDTKMQWWKEARYGMFIHWGVYALPAGVWNGKRTGDGRDGAWLVRDLKVSLADYKAVAAKFNPTDFNADAWVQFAKNVGFKYIVITAKHHDGFALFPSKASTFNIVDATPFKRDVIKELAVACKKQNIKLGLYYSQAQDWSNGGANYGNDAWWDESQKNRDFDKYIDSIVVPQVKEILAYEPDIIWWDTPVNMTKERAAKIQSILANYPNIITNNRLGGNVGGDFGTPEQYIPATSANKYWESCLTTSSTNTWGFKSRDSVWKSATYLIRSMIEIVSKGGNLLLNVGPDAKGNFPKGVMDTLKAINTWLKTNGESIYASSASPFPYLSFGKATQKNNVLYLHILKWPADGKIKIPLKTEVTKATFLAAPKTNISFSSDEKFVYITLPKKPIDTIATVLKLDIKGSAISSVANLVPSINKTATASSEETPNNKASNAFDTKSGVWRPAKDQKTAWLQVDLGEPASIGAITINEYAGSNIKQFAIEYKVGEEWKILLEGKTVGATFVAEFVPIKAQIFRLNILDASKQPQISDMQLFFAE